jgi:hypothetical protein
LVRGITDRRIRIPYQNVTDPSQQHCSAQDGLWESLDDWVYYIRSFGNSVEFCFAVFLFFNGAWILLFESGGTIRAVMMLVHAYFNIWCEAK